MHSFFLFVSGNGVRGYNVAHTVVGFEGGPPMSNAEAPAAVRRHRKGDGHKHGDREVSLATADERFVTW